jgi:NAD(P)H-nitrite reductase large subunit
MHTRPIVIIGTSAAGVAALSTLRRLLPKISLVCIDQENDKPYNTCLLTACLAQIRNTDSIGLLPTSWYNDPLITWHLGTKVTALDTKNKSVIMHTGQTINYSKLLLAVGTKPVLVPEHKTWLEQYHNVLAFYTATDLYKILEYIREHGVTQVAIIGAGLTGLECADALSKLNISVWLIESKKTILSHLFDEQAGLWLLQKIPATLTLTVLTETSVSAVYAHERDIRQVKTLVVSTKNQDMQELSVQLVILATGVRPALELAEQAELELYQVGGMRGIRVNQFFQTSDENIYAAGDCALYGFSRSTTWSEALRQGVGAAYALATTFGVSQFQEYTGVINCATTTLFGIPLGYCDKRVLSEERQQECKLYWQQAQDQWCGVFIQMASDKVQGGIVMGSVEKLHSIKQACQMGMCYKKYLEYFRTSI